jgi:hypothetical protein
VVAVVLEEQEILLEQQPARQAVLEEQRLVAQVEEAEHQLYLQEVTVVQLKRALAVAVVELVEEAVEVELHLNLR